MRNLIKRTGMKELNEMGELRRKDRNKGAK
jgi:hypothetical protein